MNADPPIEPTESNLPTATATTDEESAKIQEQNEFNQLKEEVSKQLTADGTLPKLKVSPIARNQHTPTAAHVTTIQAELKFAVLQAIRQQNPPSDNGTATVRDFAKKLADSVECKKSGRRCVMTGILNHFKLKLILFLLIVS
jgi:hypothetical protein